MFKRVFSILAILAIAAAVLVPATVFAQASPFPGVGTLVTITGARGDAGTRCDSATAGTLTLQVPAGGFSNYLTSLGVWAMASGVPTAATPTEVTLTGITGTTPKVFPIPSVFPAAGAQGSVAGGYMFLATPLKFAAAAGAIVPATAITNFPQDINACYYQAP